MKERIQELREKIRTAPEGELFCWKVRGKYFKRVLKELEYNEQKSRFRKKPKSSRELLFNPMYRELILSGLDKTERERAIWMTEDYDKNPYMREKCIFKTPTGEKVRSKSEYIIYNALLDAKIPFRYDSGISLEGHTVYPDFVIMHPRTGKLYIWEHLGKMDDPEYIEKNIRKLGIYSRNGWVLMKTLLITTETSDQPLDIDQVHWIIEHYFLD